MKPRGNDRGTWGVVTVRKPCHPAGAGEEWDKGRDGKPKRYFQQTAVQRALDLNQSVASDRIHYEGREIDVQ